MAFLLLVVIIVAVVLHLVKNNCKDARAACVKWVEGQGGTITSLKEPNTMLGQRNYRAIWKDAKGQARKVTYKPGFFTWPGTFWEN